MTLRGERLNRGLSVEEFAAQIGIKPSALYYYERTGGMPKSPAVAKSIADLLGVKVTDIWPVTDPMADEVAA